MSRRRWIQIAGELVEVTAGYTPEPRPGPLIMPDIAPYQAMGVDIATGKAPVIHSRSQHREYLRRNGYVEIGNEKPKLRDEVRGDFDVRPELGRVVREVLQRR
jgi:hypothetical protein